MQSEGIVLKRFFPTKEVLHLFDREAGIISTCFADRLLAHRLWPGMHITYTYVEKGTLRYISSMDILYTPTLNCYNSLRAFERLMLLHNICLQKNIPNKKSYLLLVIATRFFLENAALFLAIECWLSAILLQDSGYWDKKLFPVINTFFVKLSILIDSFAKQEVEWFEGWLSKMNMEYKDLLEAWIDVCVREHNTNRY